jgi:hypothetical protein
MAAYTWKSGFHLKADAQKVGEQMARIEKKGPLTPSALVKANRREGTPLHDYFEWDDAIAADKYREVQASYVIRAIEITVKGCTEPTRAYVSVSAEGGGFSYINVEAALSMQPTRDEVLENALAELREFEKKYSGLMELASVIEAIRKVA